MNASGHTQAEPTRRLCLCLVAGDEGELVIAGQSFAVLDGNREVDGVEGANRVLGEDAVRRGQHRLGAEHQQRQRPAGETIGVKASQQGAGVQQTLGPSGGMGRTGELEAGHDARYDRVFAIQQLEPQSGVVHLVGQVGPHDGAGVGVEDQREARSAARASLAAVPLPRSADSTSSWVGTSDGGGAGGA